MNCYLRILYFFFTDIIDKTYSFFSFHAPSIFNNGINFEGTVNTAVGVQG